MFGSILGAFSGGINQVSFSSNHSINVGYHMAANCVGSLGTYLWQTAYMDGNLKKYINWWIVNKCSWWS
ncbi:MAG: hypothetical protein L6U99_04660 [Clostridium sp.]|nr:MAG: hypothetical protein L6U99_04660 [Clostridium sp.]